MHPKSSATTGRAVEYITEDPHDSAEWTCVCGNTTFSVGFSPCDAQGVPVEPTPEAWTTNAYVCMDCGRIIDQDTCQVVGCGDVTLWTLPPEHRSPAGYNYEVENNKPCAVCGKTINYHAQGRSEFFPENAWVCRDHGIPDIEAALGRTLIPSERFWHSQ